MVVTIVERWKDLRRYRKIHQCRCVLYLPVEWALTQSWRVLLLQNFLHRPYVSCLHTFLWIWSWFFVTSHRLVRGLQVLVDIRGCDLRSGETSTEPGDNGRRKQQEACINTVQRRGGYCWETASYWELPFLEGLRGNQALVDCILGVKTPSDVQVTSGYLSGVYNNTLTREQTLPQADQAFSQSDQPYVVTGMV